MGPKRIFGVKRIVDNIVLSNQKKRNLLSIVSWTYSGYKVRDLLPERSYTLQSNISKIIFIGLTMALGNFSCKINRNSPLVYPFIVGLILLKLK